MPSPGEDTAIVGVGYTPFSRDSGQTTWQLAVQACRAALTDAGLDTKDADGVIQFHENDSTPALAVAMALGIQEVRWFEDLLQGGPGCCGTVLSAAAAIKSGMANVIVCFRAMNGRSGQRIGAFGADLAPAAEWQFVTPFGIVGPPVWFALWAQRYKSEYSLSAEDFANVVITQRVWAALNPRALLREPLTLEKYLDAPLVADPLRTYDCCREVDGACAVVVANPNAANWPHTPIRIRAGGYAAGRGAARPYEQWEDYTRFYSHLLAPRLWKESGLGPGDIDVAEIYDAFSFTVPVQLEDFGFCEKGEGAALIASGATAPGGTLPTNTHGGLLCEGYLHGMNHVCEAVEQLRHEAGERQVADAEAVLVTGFGGALGSALILTN